MDGLDPAIHVSCSTAANLGGRVKPVHDVELTPKQIIHPHEGRRPHPTEGVLDAAARLV